MEDKATLSMSDEAELKNLALELLHFMPVPTASENTTILQCWVIIHGARKGQALLDQAARKTLFL